MFDCVVSPFPCWFSCLSNTDADPPKGLGLLAKDRFTASIQTELSQQQLDGLPQKFCTDIDNAR